MYYNDHQPPHFHVDYCGEKALVSIKDIKVIKGTLPNKQKKLVLEWAKIHQKELLHNWELAKAKKNLVSIAPL